MIGVDNLNDYYDVRLKDYRLGRAGRGSGGASTVIRGGRFMQREAGGRAQAGGSYSRRWTLRTRRRWSGCLPSLGLRRCSTLGRARGCARAWRFRKFPTCGRTPKGSARTRWSASGNLAWKQALASTLSLYAGCPLPFAWKTSR